MIFADRSRDRGVGHLEWRVRLMGAGCILAVAGMYADVGWLVWAAVVVLLAGLAVRLVAGEG
ncbi:MAG TPA: hypothetical protein VGA70_04725, partial [Longimicrobiales bacterium]